MIVDEYGGLAGIPKQLADGRWEPSLSFGYGASIVHDLHAFGDISRRYRSKKRDNPMKELKAKRMPHSDRKKMAGAIRKTGTKTVGFYMMKDSHPYECRMGYVTILNLLVDAADVILSGIPDDNVLFVLDHHTAYDVEKREKMPETSREFLDRRFRELSAKYGKNIRYTIGDSRKGDWIDEIQTNDIVPHSLMRVVELNDNSLNRILRTRRYEK